MQKALNQIPGLIVLVFGMLSVFAASSMIVAYKDLNTDHRSSTKNIFIFKSQLHIFEDYFSGLLKQKEEKHTFAEVKDELAKLGDRFSEVVSHYDTKLDIEQANREQFERLQYHIMQDIQEMSRTFTLFDNANKSEKEKYSKDILNQIRFISIATDSYHGLLNDIHHGKVTSGDIEWNERLLYWSVIAIAFAGFILAVLNAHKLVQLSELNEQKRNDLDLLSKRLSALDMAQEGILIVSPEDTLQYINKSLCMLLNIDEHKRGDYTNANWFKIFGEKNKADIKEDMLPELIEKGKWHGELGIFRSDGSFINTDVYFACLPEGGFIGTLQDISERYKAASEKRELEEQFYQAQKMEAIGRLAGGIAHDFNNILAAMNGYAEFLVEDLEEESEPHHFAQSILSAGLQARSLVDQMLAFSRRSNSTFDTINVLPRVKEALSMLRATLPKTIEVHENISIQAAHINGNATQISQLIMNLCVNAQDAIGDEHGKIEVTTDIISSKDVNIDVIREGLPDKKETPSYSIQDVSPTHAQLFLGHLAKDYSYVRICVHDTGSGMSRIVMEHIFEPFFTTKTVDKGTGLGLSTALGIVAIHQGFMFIDSVLGKGTCFELYFPLSEDYEEYSDEDESHEEPEVKISKSRKHILVVDDQENVRSMITKMLSRMGYDVSEAETGMHGLDLVRENPDLYDLILTDQNMPKMTGIEMVQQIYLDLPEIPFIMLSGYSEENMQNLIGEHVAIKSVLRKPISKDALSKELDNVLRQAGA